MRRAAFFESRADYFGRPFDDGILRALQEAGFAVDVYSPGGDLEQDLYDPQVRRLAIEFSRRSALRELRRLAFWRSYDVFLGTADLAMGFAGVLAAAAGRPSVAVVDEVYVGGYEGEARGWWKTIARWSMRRARFTVITDACRVPLQRDYAGMTGPHLFLDYPSYYPFPYRGPTRDEARRTLGIGESETVVSVTGGLTAANGAHWALSLLEEREDVKLMIQPGGRPDPVTDVMLVALQRRGRVIYLPERLGWIQSMELTAAADVGLVFYLSSKPQFQAMGFSSQKLCAYLWLGIPVVATAQPSFLILEERDAGRLIASQDELAGAIQQIVDEWSRYAAGAAAFAGSVIHPREKKSAIAAQLVRL